ncbi:MAG: sugar transferase [Opitutales bacterium]|jgi:lipopolysaccharide/colanic/teichoic acid biosynthesis glycosyltransferase
MLNRLAKRLFDILGSLAIITAISPLFAVLTLMVLFRDGRPVLFRQARVGLNGKLFKILKYRSMIPVEKQAPSVYADQTWTDGVPDDFVFKSGNNPNVTPTGAFLRKYSLDELPQFFNVLGGTMSLVGPRPEIPAIADYYNAAQRRRLQVKPGITGWAQINGRADINNGRKIALDLYYVEHQSLWLDVRIMIRTLIHAVTGKGAV